MKKAIVITVCCVCKKTICGYKVDAPDPGSDAEKRLNKLGYYETAGYCPEHLAEFENEMEDSND